MTTEANANATPPTPPRAIDWLSPIEAPLNELETRLAFLVEYFTDTRAEMEPAALHLFLSDCRDAAAQAHERWCEAWTQAGRKSGAGGVTRAVD